MAAMAEAEKASVVCEVCGEPASLFETNVDEGTESAWCLDHPPERMALDAKHCKAVNEFVSKWGAWLEERKAEGKTIPSWRVAASSAFGKGVEFGRAHPK